MRLIQGKKIKQIQAILDELFPNPPIPLFHKDAYTLLIAVVLSARCTDAKVNQVTPTLFARASSPQQMIQLSIEEIQKIIKPCGLSLRKASNIWELSQILIDQHQGKVPKTFQDLESLPGVGHKTASVVIAQAFAIPTFPIDTHIFRCAKRWGLSHGKTVLKVENDLKNLFPKKSWIKIHLQMIYYARQFCPARSRHLNCKICSEILRK